MSDEAERRAWLLPPATGVVDEVDLSRRDPGGEGDRHFLFLAEHPELADAIKDNEDEIDLGHQGGTMSPRLHLAMHEVVANQIWHDDPPEVWSTTQR